MVTIGIDIGGTNTDGALLINDEVHSCSKIITTDNITDGIDQMLTQLLTQSNIAPDQVIAVMLGTTHFLNALIQRKNLTKVAVIRLCLPASSFLLPFTDWPDDAKMAIDGGSYLLHGGYQYDGSEISPLDEKKLRMVAKEIKERGLKAVAISSIFSFINSAMELRAAQIIREENPDICVSMSHYFMRAGLLERENVTIINAALMPYSAIILQSIQNGFLHGKTSANLYLNRNDGTLMNIVQARDMPVLTFASGPTNSMRGAAKLTGIKHALVIDIGGTSSDIGVLNNGFPRSRSNHCYIGGVRCHFSIPDVLSIGLGGGSLIDTQEGLKVGPASTGSKLINEALIFGGGQLTLTDIYVAKGKLQLGRREHLQYLSDHLIDEVITHVRNTLEAAIDSMRVSEKLLPLIVVGGGSFMIDEAMRGFSSLIKPQWANMANAVGAAMGEISGDYDTVYDYDLSSREIYIEEAKQKAMDNAITQGADPATVEIIEVGEISIPYLPGRLTRVQARAVGKLQINNNAHTQ
jgi:N-methylhydantoinase A/oxoprolinase/acetone carboxylase beta subunit